MKLLCYGDLHATEGSELSFTEPTITLQHYRVQKFYRDLRKIYEKYDCAGVIDLGDTTGDRSSIPVPTIEALGEGLDLIPDSTWNFKLIGNHEQYLRDTSISVRRLFDHKFTVVDGSKVFDFDGWWAFFCSYPKSHEELHKWLVQFSNRYQKDGKMLFGHFQVAGCTMATGTALNGIPPEAIKSFEVGLLGHIHLPQSLGDRVHYVGSPFQQNWGEAGQQKRVAVLDTCDPPEITWVSLPGYPEYRQVTLDEFKKLASATEEHRYKIVLTSEKETEDFYKHPLCNRHEAVYNYEQVATEETVDRDWSLEGVCKRWTENFPAENYGIECDAQELLELGLGIANGTI